MNVPSEAPVDGSPPVCRAPMRSRDDAVDPGAAVERALRIGVCGVGGRLPEAPSSLAQALSDVDEQHGERMARRLERFASVPDGAFVWTRDVDGLFRLGRLAGDWRYDGSTDADEVDLVHVRPCAWLIEPVDPEDVPAAVRLSFDRGGRNWQRIGRADPSATAELWDGARRAD